MHFTDLPQEILVCIMQETDTLCILALRQTCKTFRDSTYDKQLWLLRLRHLMQTEHVSLPNSAQQVEALTCRQIEAITCRVSSLAHAWHTHSISFRSIYRLDSPRSVTWLRTIASRWLVVAAKDTISSTLELFDLATLDSEHLDPITGCFLPGPVNSGEAVVENGELLVVVAVESRTPVLTVLKLFELNEDCFFGEIKVISGYSEIVLLLSGLLVCAMKDNMAIPHVVDWKSGDYWPLATVPDHRGTRIKACSWKGHIVTISAMDVKIFTIPSPEHQPRHIQTLHLDPLMWGEVEEVTFTQPVSSLGSASPLQPNAPIGPSCSQQLSWIKPIHATDDNPDIFGIWQCNLLCHQAADTLGVCSLTAPVQVVDSYDATCLTAGASGGRILYTCEDTDFYSPFQDSVSFLTLGHAPSVERVSFAGEPSLLSIGNWAGELAVLDLVGAPLRFLFEGDRAPTSVMDDGIELLPTCHIDLDVEPSPWTHHVETEPKDYEVSLFERRLIDIPDVNTQSVVPGRLLHWSHRCEDVPFRDDFSFELSHSYEFLGRAQLILWKDEGARLLITKGGLYFVHEFAKDTYFAFRGGTTLEVIIDRIRNSTSASWDFSGLELLHVPYRSLSTVTKEQKMVDTTIVERHDMMKNRFHDMRSRGGSPPLWLTNGSWLARGNEQELRTARLGYRWERVVTALPPPPSTSLSTNFM
ncbi:hypothetical protein CONPUDRAFT_146194 [Coniophora puteana RWD-64-598 SS2]|uniref:F-box domain-containing protein n=1 Tax=Coniophora puteana (strain RWD-64-598) TaxID=741705 RepID=A0A5M3MDZ8_CONPW|nr:uncharacterized protein CONPUDRAFT_146194 [Coniophora puteana RWD-64-598 SS2]EIW77110.1 hypothetical protein CONPUDRAFT_146194 [Coniophora puteana RWD-64-598 SS2]